jgi:hypothetical protein
MISALTKLRSTIKRECVFSPDRAYRYTLWREWSVQEITLTVGAEVDPRPFDYVQFIGLNPSTADETLDDNTITRCIDFSKRWGFGAFCMTNLFAWRDTDPHAMKRAVDPIGPDNNEWLETIAQDAGLIVCCWGNHGPHRNRASEFLSGSFAARLTAGQLFAFGINERTGQPKHPLMLRRLEKVRPLNQLQAEFRNR